MTPAVRIGPTDLTVLPLGVGTWAWGDKATWGMGGYDADSVSTDLATGDTH